jgi:hypothetical protein
VIGTPIAHKVYLYFSEQAKIKEVAREKGIKDWRKLGDAVEKAKGGTDRRGDDNLSMDEIREIADQMKAGDWWSPK